jgi:hypothetical protein
MHQPWAASFNSAKLSPSPRPSANAATANSFESRSKKTISFDGSGCVVNRELEVRIGKRIDCALDRVRSKVCLTGMAGKLHIGKASDIVLDPGLLERHVVPLEEHAEAKYLERLPALIARTKKQDQRCGECWDGSRGIQDPTEYLTERGRLLELLLQFEFRPKMYERLVRQSDKPLLRDAIRLLSAGQETTPTAVTLEAIFRMRLHEFVALEEDLAVELCDLDETRQELCSAHESLALEIAGSQPRSDPSTVSSAMVGLQRAAAWYDYKQGFSFADYAQHWIHEAIDRRRE